MSLLTDADRQYLATALKMAKKNDVPNVGMPTQMLERLLTGLADLETAVRVLDKKAQERRL